ncbi:hypothetical protein ARMSODRAFT_230804 [Armillaria solidipes]|uniref:Uncharacterized protein n=1 Tax=Armillaria solidipes TaxID=1076256 RepID=A0A2H3C3R9_9AGAR|nr:hypothetical protein ARMSODRAFT_230804 [Armillaria solidipes]
MQLMTHASMTVTMSLVLSSIPVQAPPSSMQDSFTIALEAFFITPAFLPTRITTLKATLPRLSDKKASSSGPSSLSNLSIDLFLERSFLTNLPILTSQINKEQATIYNFVI